MVDHSDCQAILLKKVKLLAFGNPRVCVCVSRRL
jgi:hypothetical protein